MYIQYIYTYTYIYTYIYKDTHIYTLVEIVINANCNLSHVVALKYNLLKDYDNF